MTRDQITAAINAWEKRARAETYLPEPLHFKAKGWLVDEIEKLVLAIGVKPTKPTKPKETVVTPMTSTPQVTVAEPTMDELKAKVKTGKGRGK